MPRTGSSRTFKQCKQRPRLDRLSYRENLRQIFAKSSFTTLSTPFITLPNPSTLLRVQVLIGIVSLISFNSTGQNVFPEAREGFRRGPGVSPFSYKTAAKRINC